MVSTRFYPYDIKSTCPYECQFCQDYASLIEQSRRRSPKDFVIEESVRLVETTRL